MVKLKKWQILLVVFLFLFLVSGFLFVRKIFLYKKAIENGSIILNNNDITQYSSYLGSTNIQKENVSREELETNSSPSKGSTKPIMTIVEFADFNCPYCLSAYDDLKLFVNENKNDVKLIYRYFPISEDLSPELSATCANEQGKFWEMHDKLFENQRILSESAFMRFAKEIGLNIDKFETCYSSKKYESTIYSDVNIGLKAGVNGTPTFFVNGYIFQGVITKQIWEQLLQGVKNEIKK